MITAPRALVLFVLPLLAGCNLLAPNWDSEPPTFGDDDDSTPLGDDDDSAASVVPVEVRCLAPATSYSVRWQEPLQIQLAAEVGWSDGSSTPGQGISWVLPEGFGGNITGGGLFTTPWNHGGQVTIEAWMDSLVGTCVLDLSMTLELGDPALLAALDPSTATADASCAPALLYPEDGSAVPRNWSPLHLQWTPGLANAYLVTLSNEWGEARIVTEALELLPQTDAWRAITDVWSGSELSLRVYGGVWDGFALQGPPCVHPDPVELSLSALGLEGQIFYWSAPAQGVFRLALGAEAPTAWADTSTTGSCVGCHTSNLENPRRMATVYEGGDGWVVVSDVEQGIGGVMPPQVRRGNFVALDPTGSWMVRSFQGQLYLDDLDAGLEVGALPTLGHATHPNWSPDGLSLVYASCLGDSSNDWVQNGCSLRTLDRVDVNQFGNDSLLLAADAGRSNYYPSYSPDNAFIAFNRSQDEASYDARTAEVWLVRADGTDLTALPAANQGPVLGNSWPRWGAMHDDFVWLAFASRRAYGTVTNGIPQVYLAGLDRSALGTGVDPSRPGLWLPGQDPTIGNHTPVWVPRFVEPE